MAWSRLAWESESGTTTWTDIWTYSKHTSSEIRAVSIATMEREISTRSPAHRRSELRLTTQVGERDSSTWTMTAILTCFLLPGACIRRSRKSYPSIHTKLLECCFAIWGT